MTKHKALIAVLWIMSLFLIPRAVADDDIPADVDATIYAGATLSQDDIMNAREDRDVVLKKLDKDQARFVTEYLKALESGDTQYLKTILHPTTMACLDKNGQLDALYSSRKNVHLVKGSKIAFIKGTMYDMVGVFPTDNLYTFAISHAWCPGLKSRVTLVVTLVKEQGLYYEVMPCEDKKPEQ